MDVNVRPMTVGDVEAARAMAANLEDAPHWDGAAYESAVAREQAKDGVALVAVTAEACVVGFLIAAGVPPEIELESIVVAAEYQRGGIGQSLLSELRRLAVVRNYYQVYLEVRASNTIARAFYQKHGFIESGRRAGYYSNPADDAILMRLDV